MYRLTVHFFGQRSGFVVVIIYILYLNNLGLVLLNYTELLYGVLILGAINLYFLQNKVIFAYLAGLSLSLDNRLRDHFLNQPDPKIGLPESVEE